MDLKVYDSKGNWVRVANAADVEHAKRYAAAYAGMTPPFRVVEMRVTEVEIHVDATTAE